ncbi:Nuclear transport factor 2 [Mortierella polycephala]|uniref:Nuclear transport factor 2 n=1 Tax=Mortierella polycephala TaxID=41804 RepID=A0A9P6Q8K0_9FUNG|nr:Nuclear transport factor 2 [Mortierella polycephala]
MADPDAVAKQFITYYYTTFDGGRQNLHPLYKPTSMLTFEGAQVAGADAIIEKLVSLPLGSLRHNVSTQDVQPIENGLLISVTGQLLAEGESNPQFFTQTFLLKSDGPSYYVQNDIFRLVYA